MRLFAQDLAAGSELLAVHGPLDRGHEEAGQDGHEGHRQGGRRLETGRQECKGRGIKGEEVGGDGNVLVAA